MSAALVYPHIIKPEGDSARLEKHPRARVSMIAADYLWRGWSAEEIVRQYPYLTLAEVHAALTCFFDHQDEIEAELEAEAAPVAEEAAAVTEPAADTEEAAAPAEETT